MIKYCKMCGAEFSTDQHARKYCDDCRFKAVEKRKYKKKSIAPRICKDCGRTYKPKAPTQKICAECREIRNANKKAKPICRICGCEFDRPPRSRQVDCDHCKETRKRDIHQIYKHTHTVDRERVCPICGLLFVPGSNNQKYCTHCRTFRKPEIAAYNRRMLAILERQMEPKAFPSPSDILRKAEEWYEKTGEKYSYGQYVYLQSIGRVP